MNDQSHPALPVHVGIIPDGNRRWAKQAGVTDVEGHQRGADIFEDVGLAGFKRGVKYVTSYAFSNENWNRPESEIKYLMKLFERLLDQNLRRLEEKGVRLRVIGRRERLPKGLVRAIDDAQARTATNDQGTFSICLNYGGLQELADAASVLEASGHPAPYTEEQLAANLYAPDIPPVDLVIRTSGEERTSGFMLARAAYAELYFVDKYWPDFTPDDLDVALAEYAHRQRRFGA